MELNLFSCELSQSFHAVDIWAIQTVLVYLLGS